MPSSHVRHRSPGELRLVRGHCRQPEGQPSRGRHFSCPPWQRMQPTATQMPKPLSARSDFDMGWRWPTAGSLRVHAGGARDRYECTLVVGLSPGESANHCFHRRCCTCPRSPIRPRRHGSRSRNYWWRCGHKPAASSQYYMSQRMVPGFIRCGMISILSPMMRDAPNTCP